MYKAMDIAHYIINQSIDNGKSISNLKLQKILYYVQAAFLINKKEACYSDSILRWRHGPVIKEVYDEYKQYGNDNINDIQTEYTTLEIDDDFRFKYKKMEYNKNNICEIDRKIIDKVIESKIDLDAWTLVQLTHEEGPWINTNSNQVISNEIIKQFFDNNRDRIYGEAK